MTIESFLNGFALSQYDAMVGVTPSTEGGITCWPGAVYYFLTNYGQAEDIMKAVRDLQGTKQRPEEEEKQFSCRINDPFKRCCNILPPEKVINI